MTYYCIKQHDITDCGAACLATISKQYGLSLPISRIREAAGTDKQGTNLRGLVQAAERLGFAAKAVKGDQNALLSDFPLPAIAHVLVDGRLLHYVVIHKITKKRMLVADPAKGMVKYTPEDFFKIWTGVLVIMMPSEAFKKGNETKGTLSRFFSLLLPQKGLLAQIFLASLLITVFGIGASFYFRFIMDEVVVNGLERSLTIVSIGVLALYVFKAALEYFRGHLMLYMSQKLDIPLILGYYQHVLRLPMSFFGTRRVGEIISRFTDASKIRDAISSAALSIMIDTLMAVVGAVVLYLQSRTLFFIAVLLLLLYGLVVFAYNHSIRKANEQVMEDNSQVTSYLIESLNGIETVKAYTYERHAEYETEKLFVRFLKSIFHGGMLANGQQTLTGVIAAIGEIAILWVGTASALKGDMTMGQLITFNALLGYFLTPIQNLINLQPTMQIAVVAADRLSEVLELSAEQGEDEHGKLKDISLRQPISISNLDFRYGTRELVLHSIDLHIRQGEKIALVGESGSGKTTLVKLLMRIYLWENGEICFGDYNAKDIALDTLRQHIAYIPQETFLFSGTIRDNLLLGNENAPLEEIIEACKMSCANEFIEKMPTRYDTLLEENGANLSGGQRQRLAIARALLKKPDVLILDEATSNLDSVTEKAIEKTIDNLPDTVTTIIIAHRLSTIMHCDTIYVMDNGRIVESGNHEKLMQSKGIYYQLWEEQSPTMQGGDMR